MAEVIAKVGPFAPHLRTEGTHFDALIRSIVYQQLSGKAAATIHGRVRALFSEDKALPPQIFAAEHDVLRNAGLSNQKARYVRNLAEHTLNGSLLTESLHELEDQAIIDSLTQVKGIGRWSAQMFLMFRLGRLDVLPELDLGVQKGIQVAYRMRKLPKPQRVLETGARWEPYRTVGAWYMWRVLELPAGSFAGPRPR
ncbi:MAG: DNA-3-methyladenine glycosylase 2 family protein [Gemmatimonadales bacterium]